MDELIGEIKMEIWEIQPKLFQSSKIETEDSNIIAIKGVNFILDLEGGLDPRWISIFVDGYIYWHIFDLPFLPNERDLWEYSGMAYRMWERGKTVLVHCAKGHNRSGLVNGMILHIGGMSGEDAVALIQSKVPGALTNSVFREYLEKL